MKSAMRISNMANTFYMCDAQTRTHRRVSSGGEGFGDIGGNGGRSNTHSSPVSPTDTTPSNSTNNTQDMSIDANAGTVDSNSTKSNTSSNTNTSINASVKSTNSINQSIVDSDKTRLYLHKEPMFQSHTLWRTDGFWDTAMLIGIANKLDLRDPIHWDDVITKGMHTQLKSSFVSRRLVSTSSQKSMNLLKDLEEPTDIPGSEALPSDGQEQLYEIVIDIHTHIFGQLGSISLTMHALGMTKVEVHANIMCLCSAAQLTEDHVIELIRNIE